MELQGKVAIIACGTLLQPVRARFSGVDRDSRTGKRAFLFSRCANSGESGCQCQTSDLGSRRGGTSTSGHRAYDYPRAPTVTTSFAKPGDDEIARAPPIGCPKRDATSVA